MNLAEGASSVSTPDRQAVEDSLMSSWRSNTICVDTAGPFLDSGGDSCSWYASYRSSCGVYDDADFVASIMCCECGGGRAELVEPLVDTEV